ncbi:NAD(P)-binding protein [Aspergillus sclerotiicarbonarius CBS 121057]|uniref:NAD(P)-binding protein n=1 Tax=Aspergillus sclerotiicarbonarius (strain CBS 121057 / IBT 28362) TaxID=1448318 RepID=A0A319FFB3_ASPSB|nr:NAD(P)-binding protein [Aspergillus sclerotiicarbonarius CBS 121057]
MVKIAIAGGSSHVAKEIIDVLVAEQKHEILILSRKDATEPTPGLRWVKADYDDPAQLTQALQGVHTVLSFVNTQNDPTSRAQKALIDAAVQAGVKRFAPSEWVSSGLEHMSWYAYKGEIRRYLHELNKDKKVLEYTLFQPGLFVNYLTHPYQSARHLHSMEPPFDFANRRAILLDGSDANRLVFTAVQDLANVVARAIDFEGEWPVVGGIRGTSVTMAQLIALGEKVRGGTPFAIERVKAQGLETGTWEASWVPKLDHPSIPPEQVDGFSKSFVGGILLAISAGGFEVSDEWNRLLPDYKFTPMEQFLSDAWREKP